MNAVTPDTLNQAHKASVDASIAIANVLFANTERFVPLTLNLARDSFDDAAVLARDLLAAKTPEDLIQLATRGTQPAVDRGASFAQSVYELVLSNQRELVKQIDANVAEMNKSVSAALDAAGKNGPAGSDMALAAMKSAMVAANSAYDSLNKAGLQAADLAVSNLDKATEAGRSAVAAATPAAKTRKSA